MKNLYLPVDVILQKLELMNDQGLTNAALLLFGKQPPRFFANHYEIKCGKFVADHGYDEILNEQEFSHNVILFR